MIIQGSNNPLTIVFDASVADVPTLVVTLWQVPRFSEGAAKATLIKRWDKADMMVSGDTVVCQIAESETANLPVGDLTVEAKGLDSNGKTLFWAAKKTDVLGRYDRVIRLTQEG